MGLFNKIKAKFQRKSKNVIDVPKVWLPDNKDGTQRVETISVESPKKPSKFRIPGLRTAKRVLAILLLVGNFLISQFSLTTPAAQPFAIFFLLNSFILIDYLWKTRKEKQIFEKAFKT